MASIEIHGVIQNISYLDNCVIVKVNEPKSGYTKKDGTKVNQYQIGWRCIFNSNTKKTIGRFFHEGSYVIVRGDVLPYAIRNGEYVDGCTVNAHLIHYGVVPTNKRDLKIQKESQEHSTGIPDLEGFNNDDF